MKPVAKIDVDKVKELATKEFEEELTETAKERVKSKLRQLTDAQTVVENIKRELEDLYDAIAQGN